MEIGELSHEEQVALVGLLEAVTISDGTVSEGEQQEIGRVAAALGDDTYRELLDEAENRFTDWPALRACLAAIDNPQARELIYGTVMDEALVEANSETHARLRWLADTWDIDVELVEG